MKLYIYIILALLSTGCDRDKDRHIELLQMQLDSITTNYHQIEQSFTLFESKKECYQAEIHRTDSLMCIIDSLQRQLANPFSFKNLVRVRYRNKINGYRVSAVWQPEYSGWKGKVIGKAILNFSKNNVTFSMVHSHFFLQGAEGESDSAQFSYDYNKIYEICYPATSDGSYLRDDVPFFFVDGGKKLVLTMWFEGQRHSNAYRFYLMDSDGTCKQDDLYQITYNPPYKDIDDSTEFLGDQIINHASNGAFEWSTEYYKKNKWGTYKLHRIVQRKDDTLYTYKPLRLIDRQYIEQSH